ncbi:histidine phosphatase family protein [Lacticaseibacillus daqingensis]|uniref:histidine phosphatase family protein n=1 Tax=Lacticaseibacillus daqingensis TaxID=2486014 RepID=UPI000F7B524B|nr:histidine phosphatase family protein [Lacticaseibacillus daqingensis]
MTELWLVRHGQTEYNVQDRVQGMANSALTPAGRAGAAALGRGFKQAGVTFDAAFSSDLARAQDTAQLALAAAGQASLPLTLDAGLREENYGKYEGQLTNDFAQSLFGLPDFKAALLAHELNLAQIADATYAANADQTPNRAEDNGMVQRRFDAALRTLTVGQTGRLLVVTHGTVTLMWLNYIGFDTRGQEMLHNTSVTRVAYADGIFTVHDFDDDTYLTLGKEA